MNGASGIITEVLNPDVFVVKLFSTGALVLVHPMYCTKNGMSFVPCVYGYATTIRRAQGATLFHGCVYFGSKFPAVRGYGYVGVSRFKQRSGVSSHSAVGFSIDPNDHGWGLWLWRSGRWMVSGGLVFACPMGPGVPSGDADHTALGRVGSDSLHPWRASMRSPMIHVFIRASSLFCNGHFIDSIHTRVGGFGCGDPAAGWFLAV